MRKLWFFFFFWGEYYAFYFEEICIYFQTCNHFTSLPFRLHANTIMATVIVQVLRVFLVALTPFCDSSAACVRRAIPYQNFLSARNHSFPQLPPGARDRAPHLAFPFLFVRRPWKPAWCLNNGPICISSSTSDLSITPPLKKMENSCFVRLIAQ